MSELSGSLWPTTAPQSHTHLWEGKGGGRSGNYKDPHTCRKSPGPRCSAQ